MRLIVLAVALLAAMPARADDRAFVAAQPSASPRTWASGSLVASLRRAERVTGVDLALVSAAELAPHPQLALGVEMPLALTWAGDGLNDRVRAGVAPTSAWIGTGAAWDAGGIGARLTFSIAPGALGAQEIDLGSHSWSLGLSLAAAHDLGGLELAIALDAALLSRGPLAGAGGGLVSALIGEPIWPIRPFVAIEVRGSNDLGAGGTLALGAWIPLSPRLALRTSIRVAAPDHPAAELGAIVISVVVLDPAPVTRRARTSSVLRRPLPRVLPRA